MPQLCSLCKSERTIPYEPRLNNGRFLCLHCSHVFLISGHDESYPLNLKEKDAFEQARIFTERKAVEWLGEISQYDISKSKKQVVKRMRAMLEENDYHWVEGNYYVEIRIFYNGESSSAYGIRLEKGGLKLRCAYYENDLNGNKMELACFENYPLRCEDEIQTLSDSLNVYSEAVKRMKNKPFFVRAFISMFSPTIV